MKFDPLAGDNRESGRAVAQDGGTFGNAAEDVRCPSCGGGPVAQERVNTALWRGDALAVVRDVPAAICRSCHDQFFDDETVTRLDLMRAGDFGAQSAVARLDVPVFVFPAAREVKP